MKKYFLVFMLCVTLVCCTKSKTYVNRDSDKNKAMKIANSFYDASKNGDFNKVLALFSKNASATSIHERNNKLKIVLAVSNDSLGKITSINLSDCKTKVVEFKRKKMGEFLLKYSVKRNNKYYIDLFKMNLEHGKVKILDYHIMLSALK